MGLHLQLLLSKVTTTLSTLTRQFNPSGYTIRRCHWPSGMGNGPQGQMSATVDKWQRPSWILVMWWRRSRTTKDQFMGWVWAFQTIDGFLIPLLYKWPHWFWFLIFFEPPPPIPASDILRLSFPELLSEGGSIFPLYWNVLKKMPSYHGIYIFASTNGLLSSFVPLYISIWISWNPSKNRIAPG